MSKLKNPYSLLTIALLGYGAFTLFDKQNQPFPTQVTTSTNSMPADITIPADRSGHYRGIVLVNNVAMPFVIDTGATLTSIPINFAKEAKLPFGESVSTSTANGLVNNPSTFIDSLRLGNIEIKNIDASIMANPGVNTPVLIGMNTLRYFRIIQDQNSLSLTAYATR